MRPQPLVLYVYVFPARIVVVAAVQMLVVAAVVHQNRLLYLRKIQNRRICDNQLLVRDYNGHQHLEFVVVGILIENLARMQVFLCIVVKQIDFYK